MMGGTFFIVRTGGRRSQWDLVGRYLGTTKQSQSNPHHEEQSSSKYPQGQRGETCLSQTPLRIPPGAHPKAPLTSLFAG